MTTTSTAISIDKFLTPESMVTPGVAGSLAMMIGNALHFQFGVSNGWSILILSFLIGLLVLANTGSILTRGVLYVVNSLVIFCMAAGAITLSADSAKGADTKKPPEAASSFSLQSAATQQTLADLQTEYKNLSAQYDALWKQLKAGRPGQDTSQLLKQIEAVELKRAAVLRSIQAQTSANTQQAGHSGKRKFFAPLTFK